MYCRDWAGRVLLLQRTGPGVERDVPARADGRRHGRGGRFLHARSRPQASSRRADVGATSPASARPGVVGQLSGRGVRRGSADQEQAHRVPRALLRDPLLHRMHEHLRAPASWRTLQPSRPACSLNPSMTMPWMPSAFASARTVRRSWLLRSSTSASAAAIATQTRATASPARVTAVRIDAGATTLAAETEEGAADGQPACGERVAADIRRARPPAGTQDKEEKLVAVTPPHSGCEPLGVRPGGARCLENE